MPSDNVGAEFGPNYFNPDGKLPLGEQFQNYMERRQTAPNNQILLSEDPKTLQVPIRQQFQFSRKQNIIMTTKRIYIIASTIILSILLFFFVKGKRERDLTRRGENVIERIEFFRMKHHRLPKNLNEIGVIEEENSNALYYDVRNDTSYTVSFMMSIDYNKTYYSDTKKWENGYREIK
ncbi:hypothetical protein [Hoylesella loescheii]|uniref:Uncharacterized protein n=1 Tax=Hoylesella loescheii DSM 19665 = JCM 12249 = ATCC 15930 TaxID=1122985 RepID=A0A069QLQ1_HOYLO|nr:hypothetical protein [Hoylesella loescheii]KDR50751.1 hypothetical protein HMPREF1991_03193 [Hoylesella loescheii DSM 19665 = JCM 12249 = ATCC 15930]